MQNEKIKRINWAIDQLTSCLQLLSPNQGKKKEYILNDFINNKELKIKYKEYQKCICSRLRENFCLLSDLESFEVAFFTIRCNYKILMYNESMDTYSFYFKLTSLIYFEMLKCVGSSYNIINSSENKTVLHNILELANTILLNMKYYNQHISQICDEEAHNFENKISYVSSKPGDIYSYKIKSTCLQQFKNLNNLKEDTFWNRALKQLKGRFITKDTMNLDNHALFFLNHSNYHDDLFIIYKQNCLNRYTNFINCFKPDNNYDSWDCTNDFIFAHEDSQYFYVSKKMMSDVQEQIKFFATRGLYSNIFKRFYKIDNAFPQNRKDYNRLLTYKIADLLMNNGYKLPMEKKTINGLKLVIPQIEIKNFENYPPSLGDVDVMFISEFTKILYVVEFKNYEMLITRTNDITSDISKVQRDDIDKKLEARRLYVVEHSNEILKKYFKTEEEYNIKSMILLAKPNIYFEKKNVLNKIYYEWDEFKSLVLERFY